MNINASFPIIFTYTFFSKRLFVKLSDQHSRYNTLIIAVELLTNIISVIEFVKLQL